ncbi:MAG: hypothetical protein H6734_04510 [Alphaproteobacteria bacterium]|nr:hypothetical protein [Alphaproteobacteria bacterium]
MTLLFALSTAHACVSDTMEACIVVGEVTEITTALNGGVPVISESGPVRLQPDTIAAQLDELTLVYEATGCSGGPFDRWIGGMYTGGSWNGGWAFVETSWDASGTVGSGAFSGDLYDESLNVDASIGTVWSGYDGSGRLAGDQDGAGFVIGRWIRVAGRRGVFIGISGACAGGPTPDAVVQGWLADGTF